jgi:hypothetical protein
MHGIFLRKVEKCTTEKLNQVDGYLKYKRSVIQDYQILNHESNPSKDYRLTLQVPGLLVLGV